MKAVRFLGKMITLILQCVIAVEVLILIGVFPILFKNLTFNPSEYFQAIIEFNKRLVEFTPLTIDGTNPIFPTIFDKYIESMKILGLGILAACSIAFFLSYLAFFFFKKRMKRIKNILEIAEAIPDLMLILLLQLAVIVIYKNTGIKLATVVSVREKAILLPVICLSVPISFYITKVIIHHIEEELEKYYVELAKAKGLTFSYILNIHVLRNIVDGLFGTSKTVFWSMLSTLLVIDYLFNMNGLMRAMLVGTDPFVIGCILIFVPFFLLYRVYEWVSFERRRGTP
ncbi:ABC transporter permease subunit [Neobacillus niacini]|uniref:ABC transporter permease subunit n=1 Tax=Neobacillus niacini TaxID=86668 RepID=UPI0021CB37CB|nr:ABC transporter permease subunit [Neobacillus niacini]MCM3768689.1 ABC transporter permease subunit [Neobacillus niacini]